jgi:hypothetical protein
LAAGSWSQNRRYGARALLLALTFLLGMLTGVLVTTNLLIKKRTETNT